MPAPLESIALGTARLVMPSYGHSSGPSDPPEAVLDAAFEAGIRRFDTSPRYERAEEILGEAIARAGARPWVSTKVDGLTPGDPASPAKIRASAGRSIERLGIERLDLCYLHQNEIEILSDGFVIEGLRGLVDGGLAAAAGASIYSAAEADFAASSNIFDFVQVPVNAFDASFFERLVHPGSGGVRFAARSLLLQGILLNRGRLESLHHDSGIIARHASRLDEIALEAGMAVQELALSFVFALKGFDHFILGTASVANLEADLSCLKFEIPPDAFEAVMRLAVSPKEWSNPRTWNRA